MTIEVPVFSRAHQTAIAVVGDVLDLQPTDRRIPYLYAVTTKPDGSSAAFSGAALTPDLAGAYLLTITAGAGLAAFADALSTYATAIQGAADSGDTATPALLTACTTLKSNLAATVADSVAIPLFVFAAAVYNGLAPTSKGEPAYDDVRRRRILQAVADRLPTATLVTWNAGTPPAIDLRQFGGL